MKGICSQEKYVAAIRFAAEFHNAQEFPGTDWPYLVHLGMVSMEILVALEYEADLDGDLAVQCALLHDTLEDTDATFEMLCDGFGKAVADGVSALTKDPTLEKGARMQDSLDRIRLQPKEIWMVKLADRVTNLQPPPSSWSNEKGVRYLAQARDIHSALAPASEFLANRLADKIEDYEGHLDDEA